MNRLPVEPERGPSVASDDVRRRMLFRKENTSSPQEQIVNNPEELRNALFFGRSLVTVTTNAPTNPTASVDESDPHKLFQLLRKKKRNPTITTSQRPPPGPPPERPQREGSAQRPSAPPNPTCSETKNSSSSGRSVPQPLDPEIIRPSALWPRGASRSANTRPPIRPNSPTHATVRPSSGMVGLRENIHSAPQRDGRPCTRQKHPKQALDLFGHPTKPSAKEAFFPKKQVRRNSTGVSPKKLQATASEGVNYQCLFASDEEMGDVAFPTPKPHVDIPLIETDWFEGWEQLPATDHPEAKDDSIDMSQSLYEMLVATKSATKAERKAHQGAM